MTHGLCTPTFTFVFLLHPLPQKRKRAFYLDRTKASELTYLCGVNTPQRDIKLIQTAFTVNQRRVPCEQIVGINVEMPRKPTKQELSSPSVKYSLYWKTTHHIFLKLK